MATFQAQALKVLDSLYRFVTVGNRSPALFDLEAPIQPVHDMSREAELQSGHGYNLGYYICMASQTHAGAGILYDVVNLYDPVNASGGYTAVDPATEWLWFIRAWGNVGAAANLTQCGVYINAGTGGGNASLLGPYDGTAANPRQLLWIGENGSYPLAAGEPAGVIDAADRGFFPRIPQPITYAQGVMGMFSQCSGADTVTLAALIWRGPKGVLPPGVA